MSRARRQDVPPPGAARSFWLQEALAADPGDRCPPLAGHVRADVAIVGGGFAGLWTAVRLREREPGLRIALLEADIVGGGASGRNGGFFSSSWYDLDALTSLFGDAEGLRYARAIAGAVGEAAAFTTAHGIDCWFHEGETLAATAGTWQSLPGERDAARRLGVMDRFVDVDAEGARAFAGSPRFRGGTLLKDNAICQPARLARGLRRFLLERDVAIFERTKVRAIERRDPAVVLSEHGAVAASKVVVATGAWAAGWPGFRRSFGVISDYVVATEPIPERLEEIGWTTQRGIFDRRDWLYYLRPTDDGRVVIGGGAGSAVFGGRSGGRAATHARRFAEVAAGGLVWLFPQLEGVRFTHAWGGPIDQTTTFLPFYRTLAPGTIHAGLGFSGHGLSQTFLAGRILAGTVLGIEDAWTSLPVNRPEVAKAPPEPLRYPAVWTAARALEIGDAREMRGRRRGVVVDLVGSAPLRYRERVVRRGDARAQ